MSLRLRMPIVGEGTPDSPWRPKYRIPEFHFFYKSQEMVSVGFQKHYDLPNGVVDLTIPEEMGKRLLAKFGVEVGGDVEFVSDETPEEAAKRAYEAAGKAAEERERRLREEQVPF